jgi:hypothetical protein
MKKCVVQAYATFCYVLHLDKRNSLNVVISLYRYALQTFWDANFRILAALSGTKSKLLTFRGEMTGNYLTIRKKAANF